MTVYVVSFVTILVIICVAILLYMYAPITPKGKLTLYIGDYLCKTTENEFIKCHVVADNFHVEGDEIKLNSIEIELSRKDKGDVSNYWIEDNFDKFEEDFKSKYTKEFVQLFI